ncbi:MAG: pseudouridine synthase, partial [Bacteroidota bacterium]
AFQQNQVQKKYLAIVHGQTPEKGQITSSIDGKNAFTRYERLQVVPSRVFRHLSLLALYPQTGRTHQLRIHLQRQQHFILGDKLYAQGAKTILGKGLFLCACQLKFQHPKTGEDLEWTIAPPAKFQKVLEREAARF